MCLCRLDQLQDGGHLRPRGGVQEGIDHVSGVAGAEETLDVEAFPPAVEHAGTEPIGLLHAAVAERHVVSQPGASPLSVVLLLAHLVHTSVRGAGRLAGEQATTRRGAV